MYDFKVHSKIEDIIAEQLPEKSTENNLLSSRFIANAFFIHSLYYGLYGGHAKADIFFEKLLRTVITAFKNRNPDLRQKDIYKLQKGKWFLSNELAGMSLYVDRFCGTINKLEEKLPYFEELGVNVLHLMPLFESPEGESDGGYAVSDFRKIDTRFGSLNDLKSLQHKMQQEDMYLMIDIVLNHT